MPQTVSFCLYDRPGSYAAVTGWLGGFEHASLKAYLRLRGKSERPHVLPCFSSFSHSAPARTYSVTRVGAYISVLQSPLAGSEVDLRDEYNAAVRAAWLSGDAGADPSNDALKRLEAGRRFRSDDPAEAVEALMQREADSQCPEIPRCPLTAAKKAMFRRLLSQGAGVVRSRHLMGFVPAHGDSRKSKYAEWYESAERKGHADMEVRHKTANMPGELATVINALLFRSLKRGECGRNGMLMNISRATTNACDCADYTYDIFDGAFEGGDDGAPSCCNPLPLGSITCLFVVPSHGARTGDGRVETDGESDMLWRSYLCELRDFLNAHPVGFGEERPSWAAAILRRLGLGEPVSEGGEHAFVAFGFSAGAGPHAMRPFYGIARTESVRGQEPGADVAEAIVEAYKAARLENREADSELRSSLLGSAYQLVTEWRRFGGTATSDPDDLTQMTYARESGAGSPPVGVASVREDPTSSGLEVRSDASPD